MSICLVDTSIFVEVLQVPGKCSQFTSIKAELKQKIEDGEKLFLPLATIIETGNHIAQNGDGRQRRGCAERFVEQVSLAYAGKSPFNPISLDVFLELSGWLSDFPDYAMKEIGFADLSIIEDYNRMCARHLRGVVYIWTMDAHLQGYKRAR